MPNLNRVQLAGYVGRDPDVRQVNGQTVASFSLATNYKFKTSSGEEKKITEWHRVIAWGWLGDVVAEQFRKGSGVWAEGRLTHRTYQNKNGQDVNITEVIAHAAWLFAPSAAKREHDEASPPSDSYAGNNDEIPF